MGLSMTAQIPGSVQIWLWFNACPWAVGHVPGADHCPLGIPFLFGETYTTSAKLLFILSFCIPIKFLATSVGGTLVTQNHMRRKVWYMGTTAVLNFILNIILIPKWTYYGAAIATFISELNLLIIYLIAVRRDVFGPDAWRGWKIYYKSK